MKELILKKRSILFHIIATYFTCGIWAILYFGCKFSNNSSDFTKNNSSFEDNIGNISDKTNDNNSFFYDINYEELEKLENKYRPILDKHYKNLEKIGMQYTVANNLSLPNSPEMQKVIDLCLEDITLAPEFLEFHIKEAKLYGKNLQDWLPNYPSFQRLAIIYEKQGEYQKAIDVCKQAIDLGFYKDGTTGQMPGRLARLIKKANKQNIQLKN